MTNCCTMCGVSIPDNQKFCSMCYGEINYKCDGHYQEYLERQYEREYENKYYGGRGGDFYLGRTAERMEGMKVSDERLKTIIDETQIRYYNAPKYNNNYEKDVSNCLLELKEIREYYAQEEENKRIESQRLCDFDFERRIEEEE